MSDVAAYMVLDPNLAVLLITVRIAADPG